MTTRFIPVHLPEFETAETPAPDHEGRPQHVPVFSAPGTVTRLRQIIHRQSLADGDMDAIFAACRLIEGAMNRGQM